MSTYAFTVVCEAADLAEHVADALSPHADALSWFEDADAPGLWRVIAYAEAAASANAFRQVVADVPGAAALASMASWEQLPDTDWVAESQARLAPVHAGGFVVHGSHDRDAVADHGEPIEIEAGAAFGTAHHGTTTGCLEAITAVAQAHPDKARILDLGTGSGILAIAARRRFPGARIVASDIDPVAVFVAAENARLNGAEAIAFVEADGVNKEPIRAPAPYDLVIANILAGPLIAMSGDVVRVLEGGERAHVILSGLLDEQADDVLATYIAEGLACSSKIQRDGWTTLILARGQSTNAGA
ncbi:MAG: 50S ribosomal protein L11 methyltransferase [Pseudomonadota bacterium]